MEILSIPIPFNHSVDKTEDRDNNDSNKDNISLCPTKQSISLYCKTNLHYTSLLLLSYNEDSKESIENIDSNSSDKIGRDDILLKRQKISDSQSSRTALSSHSR